MYRRILVPLDGTRYADHALPYAVAVAKTTGATIELLHVHHHQERSPDLAALPQFQYQHVTDADWAQDDDRLRAERVRLEEQAADIELRYGVPVRTRIVRGRTGEAIGREAREMVADLIVMATHAREGLDRIRFGDVAHELVEQLNVPALCVQPASEDAPLVAPQLRRMLITLDGSEFSEQVLDVAAPLVAALGARATLLHIVGARPLFASGFEISTRSGFATRQQALDYLGGVAARYAGKLGAEPVLSAIEAIDPGTAISQLMALGEYDVAAIATHGRSGLSRLLLGSVADRVVRRTRRPVLLYRPREVRLPAGDLAEAFRIYGE
jgi:nucleotide-binding universal stress UspA family protein